MKVARMHHSMIYVDEKNGFLTVGGENENGSLLDSCEFYSKAEKQWKVVSTLNFKGKNLGLCKFSRESRKDGIVYIYCFGRQSIERVEITKTPISTKWEEIIVK